MPIIKTSRGVIFLEGASQLAPPGEIVEPPQAPPEKPDADPAADDADGMDTPEAVKAELAAFNRWVRRNPNPRRPFQAEVLTKADAPHLAGDPRILLKQVVRPKGSDRPWPGWQRDLTTAQVWVPRLTRAMAAAVDAQGIAKRFLVAQLVKAATPAVTWTTSNDDQGQHDWEAAAALAFLHREGLDLAAALAVLRRLWIEGWLIGGTSARAVLEGDDVTDWGWDEGDSDAAQRLIPEASRTALDAFLAGAATWAASIASTRLKALATALAKGGTAGESATQIAERLRAVLTDDTWAHMAALTELTRASSAGAQAAYTDAGTALLAWNSEDDNRVCQVCLDNEGSDPQPIGGAWPDGSTAPPAHARCRCWLSPA
jgi:hypothetical protein